MPYPNTYSQSHITVNIIYIILLCSCSWIGGDKS